MKPLYYWNFQSEVYPVEYRYWKEYFKMETFFKNWLDKVNTKGVEKSEIDEQVRETREQLKNTLRLARVLLRKYTKFNAQEIATARIENEARRVNRTIRILKNTYDRWNAGNGLKYPYYYNGGLYQLTRTDREIFR